MVQLETLHRWLNAPVENEGLEFKEARHRYDPGKLIKYCAALANERGGHFVLGVSDQPPRRVVGTAAFSTGASLNDLKTRILNKLGLRVEIHELTDSDGRVLVVEVPGRPVGQPIAHEGAYLMRCGESLVPMTPDKLKRIFQEDSQRWFTQPARSGLDGSEVIGLLDIQSLFDLMGQPYPTTQDAVLGRLVSMGFVSKRSGGWSISNLAAILLAKRLGDVSSKLARKAPRVILYEGTNKLQTRDERPGVKGYAVGFEGLIHFVHASAPRNRFVEDAVRKEVKMFPKPALRELIANALVHQDFQVPGASVMIEMYEDRVEVSNPGTPPIPVARFIDEYQSRNERLADVMRRMGICEEKGSGIDKVIDCSEVYQLPAPDFRAGDSRTTAILFAHQRFSEMSRADRTRACYQHCVLQYMSNKKMSNRSLRERFGLDHSAGSSSTTSQVIAAAREEELIKPDAGKTGSTRYARYLPWWA